MEGILRLHLHLFENYLMKNKVGSQSERSETNNKQSYYKIPF